MRNLLCLLFIGLMISISSCRKDFETVTNTGNLGFSKDTVYLDTVFSNIGSSTYTLKVYNRSDDDINIPFIKLDKPGSKYRMMIDGLTGLDEDNNGVGDGRIFNNVELLAKDSMYVFIETTASIADANATDFLYTDDIVFGSSNGQQKVNLVTLIKDAFFLFPKRDVNGIKESLLLGTDSSTGQEVRINGFELDENDPINGNEYIFGNSKPYVVYGYAGVPSGRTLTINPGARVHFHASSGIVVQPGATLKINGGVSINPDNPQENEVVFEGDRLEPLYEDIPGQWGAIWLRQGSINNYINHLTLKNATVGILVENCDLKIQNSQIYNSANYGILARAAVMNQCENLVVNLAGQATLACTLGGSYDFRHCTFNNNWRSSNQVAVLMSNYEEQADGTDESNPLTKANFYNSIIYSSNNVAIVLDDVDRTNTAGVDEGVPFVFDIKNCLVKFRDQGTSLANKWEYAGIRNPTAENGNIKNQDPVFFDANANKLNIAPDSPASGKGSIAYLVPLDVLGKPRTSVPPDLGAYQSAEFPE